MNRDAFGIRSFIESETFKDRKHKICSIGTERGMFCKTPTSPNRYCILGWPSGRRDTVENYLDGVIFNESFKHVYADNWLSYYLGSVGENPVFMPNTQNGIVGDVKAHGNLRIEDEITFHKLIHIYNEQKCNYTFIVK